MHPQNSYNYWVKKQKIFIKEFHYTNFQKPDQWISGSPEQKSKRWPKPPEKRHPSKRNTFITTKESTQNYLKNQATNYPMLIL